MTNKRVDVEAINIALQRMARADPGGEIQAVDAARELDRLGVLKDSADRPGRPLRVLLRQNRIDGAYQASNRRWFVRHTQ